jgi:6-phosphogluconate dehydrogenase
VNGATGLVNALNPEIVGVVSEHVHQLVVPAARDAVRIEYGLMQAYAEGFALSPTMAGIAPWVPESGEGRWTVLVAIDLDVPAPVITLSLMRRIGSRDEVDYADRLLSAMRNQFGGHAIKQES